MSTWVGYQSALKPWLLYKVEALGSRKASNSIATSSTSSSTDDSATQTQTQPPFLSTDELRQYNGYLMKDLPWRLGCAVVQAAAALQPFGFVAALAATVTAVAAPPDGSVSLVEQSLQQFSAATCSGSKQEWIDALCDVFQLEVFRPVKKVARQLLISLAGGHTASRDVRSLHALKQQWAAVARLLQQQSATALQHQSSCGGSWQHNCKIAVQLDTLLSAAQARPRSWSLLCSQQPDVLPTLMTHLLSWQGVLASRGVQLLSLAVLGVSSSHKASGTTTSKQTHSNKHKPSSVEAQAAAAAATGVIPLELNWFGLPVASASTAADTYPTQVPAPQDTATASATASSPATAKIGFDEQLQQQLLCTPIAHFIVRFVLRSADGKMSREAARVVAGLYKRFDEQARQQLLHLLLGLLPQVQAYRPSSAQLCDLVIVLLNASSPEAAAVCQTSGSSGSSIDRASYTPHDVSTRLKDSSSKAAVVGAGQTSGKASRRAAQANKPGAAVVVGKTLAAAAGDTAGTPSDLIAAAACRYTDGENRFIM